MLRNLWSWFYCVILQAVLILAYPVVHPSPPLNRTQHGSFHPWLLSGFRPARSPLSSVVCGQMRLLKALAIHFLYCSIVLLLLLVFELMSPCQLRLFSSDFYSLFNIVWGYFPYLIPSARMWPESAIVFPSKPLGRVGRKSSLLKTVNMNYISHKYLGLREILIFVVIFVLFLCCFHASSDCCFHEPHAFKLSFGLYVDIERISAYPNQFWFSEPILRRTAG